MHALLPGADSGGGGAGAVPEPVGQAGRVRLLHQRIADRHRHQRRLRDPEHRARESLAQALDPLLRLGAELPLGLAEDAVEDRGEMREAAADAEVEPAAGEQVHSGRVLGEPDGRLVARADHRGAQPQPAGALRGGGEEGHRRGEEALEVPHAHPAGVVPSSSASSKSARPSSRLRAASPGCSGPSG